MIVAMNNNIIALWASVLAANIWAASGHEDGGAYTFVWLFVASVIYVSDVRAARNAGQMEDRTK